MLSRQIFKPPWAIWRDVFTLRSAFISYVAASLTFENTLKVQGTYLRQIT